jgi:hypothetical protein
MQINKSRQAKKVNKGIKPGWKREAELWVLIKHLLLMLSVQKGIKESAFSRPAILPPCS